MKKVLVLVFFVMAMVEFNRIYPLTLVGTGQGSDQDRLHFASFGRHGGQWKGHAGGYRACTLKRSDTKAAGRKIELIVEDDEAVPATGLTKTRKLVEKDGVHVMTGGLDGFHRLCPHALH